MISAAVVAVDLKKIEAIRNGLRLTTITKVRSFSGLARYNSWFVEGFAKLSTPFTYLTRKGIMYVLSEN